MSDGELGRTLFGVLSERSTLACMNAPAPPPEPKGKQTYRFKVGDVATGSGLGPLKAGVQVKIVERWKQHGYCYYKVESGQVHRDKDLA